MNKPAEITNAEQFAVSSPMVNFVQSGLNVNALRTNALLRQDEWKELDTAVVEVQRQRLRAVQDLRSAGLVYNLGGLGTMISQFEQQSDMEAANIDMAGVTPGEEDSVEFTVVSIPIPITHKSFRVNIRRLEASRKLGETIDVTQAAEASRKVRDGLEGMIFNGVSGIVINANSLYGYTNHPNRNTEASAGTWGTIANIYTDALDMVAEAEADYFFGPFILYVNQAEFGEMRLIHSDGSGESALERVLRGIPSISAVYASDVIATSNAVLVNMERRTIDLAVGQDVTTVEWDSMGGLVAHFKVMACMAPRLKADYNGAMGLVHLTGN